MTMEIMISNITPRLVTKVFGFILLSLLFEHPFANSSMIYYRGSPFQLISPYDDILVSGFSKQAVGQQICDQIAAVNISIGGVLAEDNGSLTYDGDNQCLYKGNRFNFVTVATISDDSIDPNAGGSANNTCNPINIATGNKFFYEAAYQSKLAFSHFYNSNLRKWSFLYQDHLIIEDNLIEAHQSDGKSILFIANDDEFIASPQRREKLVFNNSTYTLTLPDNTRKIYDVDGRLLSINPLYDEPTILTYSPNQIMVSKGLDQLIIMTNSDGQITQVTLPDNQVIMYDYGIAERLSTVTYPGNKTRTYHYEDTTISTYLTGVTDENGNRISSVQYDDQGRAISSEKGPLNSGVERTQITYNSDGTRTLTNALGKQSTYHFTQFNGEYKMTLVEGEASANCAAANKSYTYDVNGFMASKTDWNGNVTTYTHNDRGQELSRTEASGTPQARTITTEWHSDFNLPIKIIEPERTTVMTYDTNGRLLSTTYEATP